jgi:hypothetical protein
MTDGDFAIVDSTFPAAGDYPTIEAAIADGAISIFVKAGIYQPMQSITVPAGVFIQGESRHATTIDFHGERWCFIINGNDVTIQNLHVINCIGAQGTMLFNSALNCIVRECNIMSCDRAAYFLGSTFCHFNNNLCVGQNLDQLHIDTLSSDNRLENNRFTDGRSYGIRDEGSHNKILFNTLAGHTYDGILVLSTYNRIIGNTCNQNENGIYVAREAGDSNSITDNVCNANRGYGINVNSLENKGNTVVGNTCHDNGVADLRFVPGNYAIANDADIIV